MLASMRHRGPDGTGTWQQGRIALGHLRLAILDPTDASSQPMLTADGSGVLIYNGEIYNYRQIREELEREGLRFRSSGDTEVVLQALHHWGVERSLPRFDGMFAFAYFDRRDGALWLARDKLGIKPLLVADIGAELLFASEAKALLAHPQMQTRVDRQGIAKWILSRGRPQRSLFEGIKVVEPGTCWKITEGGIEKRRYFDVFAAVDVDRLVGAAAGDQAGFVHAFRDLMKRSVKLHLASDVPLAAMCSGGVDSSLIAAYAREHLPELPAYVADVEWAGGEADQAERVGRHLGIAVRRVPVDQARFLELWPHAVWHSDGPSVHASDIALLAVAQRCRAEGIKVLLTGEGSDELFGGYAWLQATYDDWRRLKSWRRHVFSFQSRDVFGYAPKLRRRQMVALEPDDELLPQRLLDLLAAVRPPADRAFLAHGLYSLYHHLSWLLHRHDRMGMAASMEMRVPFIENEMLDFAFHLPRRTKLHRGIGKWVVKQAAAEVLPRDIVYAKKKGFPMPETFTRGTQRLLSGGALPELMEWSESATEGIVAMLGKDGHLRFQVVGLELWARIFLHGEAPGALGEKLVEYAA